MQTVGTNSLSGRNNQALISYDVKPSPRSPSELDVKNYIEKLQEDLRCAQGDLKDYKKVIEVYRSEIGGMQRHLETLNNDNLKHIVPVVQHDTEFFNQAMAGQRQENINL